ncbi:MAG: hypothetical protein N3D74_04575 [Caldisericia bacterium]|nr:hypothetical protein [Caldisericia bacterium]
MFKELLQNLKGKMVNQIKTKSGDEWEEYFITDVKDEYVELKSDYCTGYVRIASIESIYFEIENDDEEEEK